MGLPCGGGEIERKARKDDKAFKSLKRSYGSVPYKMIGTWIIESTVEEQFEILFVIYALGTLLCPTASIKVSDALLKVIVATKEDFREFDCSTEASLLDGSSVLDDEPVASNPHAEPRLQEATNPERNMNQRRPRVLQVG
ncbi:hypothetical protein K1719_035256 [Acacia pycnantha]|nr:hypothetical protein K1719_035256 [Acacia pycnantha]